MTQALSDQSAPSQTVPSRRRRALLAMSAVLLAGGAGAAVWWFSVGRYHETTDDAYVAGNVVQITPQVAGTVTAIHVDDTDMVKSGAALVELDPADARVALAQAEGALAETVRQVRTLYANNAALKAVVAQREADLAKARDDLHRRQNLAGTGAVSGEEIEHARAAIQTAEAAAATAREQLLASNALTDGTSAARHPNVMRAGARVEEAYLALQRARITAPVSGQVAKRSVQLGTRVAPGQPLMAIVPLDRVWVDANFREPQLRQMRIGQTAELKADIYGARVRYRGRVVGLGAGTGAAFALLPAQNATGNWVKIVQRVPVRILLDAQEVAAHPLRVGLSMEVDVDLRDQSGAPMSSDEGRGRSAMQAPTQAAEEGQEAARQLVRRIVADNLGSAADPRAGH